MINLKLVPCVVAVTLFVSGAAPVVSAEFSGTATFWWTYKDISMIRVDDSRSYSVGIAEGQNAFESDDPNLANIAQHCLGTTNLDGTASGVCDNLDPSGDGWKETYEVEAASASPAPGALASWNGTSEVVPGSGTGKFAKMSGGSTFEQHLGGVLLDGVITGLSIQTYDLSY